MNNVNIGETDKREKTIDVLSLVRTRNGEFVGACALDFDGAGMVYSLDSVRDADGRKAVSNQWPYFESKASKKALVEKEEVPVRSCFGGMGKFRSFHLCISSLGLSNSCFCAIYLPVQYYIFILSQPLQLQVTGEIPYILYTFHYTIYFTYSQTLKSCRFVFTNYIYHLILIFVL